MLDSMDANFVGVLEQDIESLTNEIREHESTMKLKRRWLMDLPLSDKEQNRIEELLPPNDKIMPESFVREDDVSYEAIKTCIRKAFGAHNSGDEPICVQDDKRIFTGGLNKFDNARSSPSLKEPTDFRGNEMADCSASESYCAAALTVLDKLEDFPSSALRAMLRKLKGVKGYIPTLHPSKSGKRHVLIDNIRTDCMNIISSKNRKKPMNRECFTEDETAEQLAGALGVAGLTLKHIMNCPAVRDFRRFSPEMEALQNDISKAIHRLNERYAVGLIDLRKVELLLDPNSKMTDKSLRIHVRNLLIEYLYECSDIDDVGGKFIESLGIINGEAQCRPRRNRKRKSSTSKVLSSSKEVPKEEIEREIEHVLNISAQAKTVVANLLPEHVFDEDFARAYMEDFEECDTLCRFQLPMEDNSQHFEFRCYSSYGQTEGAGETNSVEFNSPVSTNKWDGCSPLSPESVHLNKREESTTSFSTTMKNEVSDFQVEERDIVQKQSTLANGYLDLQEACDNTSTVAYRFVGYMLDTLAKAQGVALHQSDRLYLQNHTEVPEVTREISNTLAQKFSGMWKNVLEH